MAERYTRRINLYINGKKVRNDISSIRKEMNRLQNEQARMTIGSKQYVAHTAKIRSLKTIMQNHNASLRKTKQNLFSLKVMAEKANHYFGLLTATIGAFVAVIAGFRKASEAAMGFEERLDNLSALTGLEGRQLEWLGQQAKNMSVATVEGNIKIKQSAEDVVDAYTKMGSQRPELLRNKEALQAVTQDAIILSEAAKGELEPAVKALAMALNQHSLSASDSRRAINVLAAGSKMGAADIPYLTAAIEKSGTSLSLMGLSLEENIALIETIAPFYTQASMAGNSLDKTFLQLKADQIGYTDGVFNLNDAIAELKYRFENGETAVDIFGKRHQKMAELLVANADDINKFKEAVTGTDIAMEQAAKNTNNRAQQLAQAKNRLQLTLIEFGNKINPIFLKSTNLVNYLIKALMKAPQIIKENEITLIAITGAILAYNKALILNTSYSIINFGTRVKDIAIGKAQTFSLYARATATRIMAATTGKATFAQKRLIVTQRALNKAMFANPLGALILAFTAVIAAIKLYDKHNKRARENEEKRTTAIHQLNKVNEFYKEDLNDITQQMGELNTMSRDRQKQLQKEIEFNIKMTEAELQLQKARQLEIQSAASYSSVWQTLINILKSGGNSALFSSSQVLQSVKNGAEAAATMDEQIQKLQETLAGFKRQKMDLSEILLMESDADNIATDTIAQLEEKLNKYTTALKYAEIGGIEYLRIQKKIAETEKLLAETRKKASEENDPKELYKKRKQEMEDFHAFSKNTLKQNLLEEKITKAEFQQEMYSLELAYLESMLLLNQKYGENTLAVQAQILDKQLAKKEEINKMLALSDEISMNLKQEDQEMFKDVHESMEKHMEDYSKAREKETEKEVTTVDEKIKAQQRMRDYYIESSVYAGQAAIEQAETMEEAGAAIMNSIREQIKAYLAEAIAMQLVQALKSVPFPFNIAIATAAGGAVSLLFNNLIPEFAAGGFTGNNARMFIAGEKGNEWIAPNWMINDQFTAPIIEALENRRTGQLNPIVPKLALGGYSNNTNSEDQNSLFHSGSDPEIKELLKQNIEMQKKIMEWRIPIDIELFQSKMNQYNEIIDNSGL